MKDKLHTHLVGNINDFYSVELPEVPALCSCQESVPEIINYLQPAISYSMRYFAILCKGICKSVFQS